MSYGFSLMWGTFQGLDSHGLIPGSIYRMSLWSTTKWVQRIVQVIQVASQLRLWMVKDFAYMYF
jgi:hypothetical protein